LRNPRTTPYTYSDCNALSFGRETKKEEVEYLKIIITLIIKTSSDSEYLINTVAKIHILSL
jgi:hypothetical protein